MIPRALHVRLLLVLAMLLVPAGALLLAASLRGARRYHQEIVQRQNLRLAENLVEQNDVRANGAESIEAVSDLVKMLAMANPGVEIYLLDGSLRIVQSASGVDLSRERVRSEPLQRFRSALAGHDAAFPILGTDPRRGGDVVFSAAPLSEGSGWLYVVLTDESRATLARSVQNSTTLRLLLWSAGLGLVIMLATGAVSFSLLTRRLRVLARAVDDFRLQDESDSALLERSAFRDDEIGRLHLGFLELAERARSQYRELETADARRRELVTNVSHDLRTPLTALRGYLEALEHADAKRARAYVASARRSAARLGRLVDQLFELSRLEDHSEPMRMEAFPPAELVSDVVQKFFHQAERRDVELHTEIQADVPFLEADMGLIERALSNILENALRHTPAGGSIWVRVADRDDRLIVSVQDTGPGMSAEDAARVFERFFRVEEGRSGEGSGLGLAIAKRVAELHGGEIGVISEVGDGARFWLSLPFGARAQAP